MTREIRYPLRLKNAFFTSLQLSRVPELPESLELNLDIQVAVNDKQFPDLLQIRLKLETPGEQPLMLSAELVGFFSRVEELPKPDRSIISDFVNEQGLHMLWPYMAQMLRLVTGQMGMNPINIRTPYMFDSEPEKRTMEPPETDATTID